MKGISYEHKSVNTYKYPFTLNPQDTSSNNYQKQIKYNELNKESQSKNFRNNYYSPSFEVKQNYKYQNSNETTPTIRSDRNYRNLENSSKNDRTNTYHEKYIRNKRQQYDEQKKNFPTMIVKNNEQFKSTRAKIIAQLQDLKQLRETRLQKKTSLNLQHEKYFDQQLNNEKNYYQYDFPTGNYQESKNKSSWQSKRKNKESDSKVGIDNPEKGHIDIKKKYPDVFKNYNNKTFVKKQELKNPFIQKSKPQMNFLNQRKVSIDDFHINKRLGQGKFGIVYRAIHKVTKTLYAIKVVPKKVLKQSSLIEQFILQLKIQSYMNHPNILKLYGFFNNQESIFLILEYMEEGTLFKLIKYKGKLNENEATSYIKHIAQAIHYLHQNSIAHRDLKPQNIVMTSGVCKLCDFGWSTICNQRRKTFCGTLEYAAPQLLQGIQYDMSIDLWCIGVLAYEMLVGFSPFHNASRLQTFKNILNVNKQEITYPKTLSQNAVNFIEYLLKKNPQQRMSIERLLNHPFLNDTV